MQAPPARSCATRPTGGGAPPRPSGRRARRSAPPECRRGPRVTPASPAPARAPPPVLRRPGPARRRAASAATRPRRPRRRPCPHHVRGRTARAAPPSESSAQPWRTAPALIVVNVSPSPRHDASSRSSRSRPAVVSSYSRRPGPPCPSVQAASTSPASSSAVEHGVERAALEQPEAVLGQCLRDGVAVESALGEARQDGEVEGGADPGGRPQRCIAHVSKYSTYLDTEASDQPRKSLSPSSSRSTSASSL